MRFEMREAHEPPEARGLRRDEVRLLVGRPDAVSHHRFTALPDLLQAGDVLVVNTSATLPAAIDVVGEELVVHASTKLDDGRWLVELRHGKGPYLEAGAGERYELKGGAAMTLGEAYTGRLWVASFDVDVETHLRAYGRPIRYSYVDTEWPLDTYQTVFATHPGSAEMPSAGRPFTESVVTRLVNRGVVIAPLVLHTGVASLEAHEKPYPERCAVPASTARLVNQATGRIIAVGTTVVRALESAAGPDGEVEPKEGWTDLVITPERGVKVVDGLLTGFHEPTASHLLMLEAIAGRPLLQACYRAAAEGGYLSHEFGDVNLLLPGGGG